MSDCKPVATPLADGLDLVKDTGSELKNYTPFRQLVGTLMNLGNTMRPDICYVANYLALFMHMPNSSLWVAGMRLLEYLQGAMAQEM